MEMYVNKQWSRRLLALLLTVCLVCTLAPAAFAEGEEEKTVEEKPGFIRAMWCGDEACELKIKEDTTATSRCMPFEQEKIDDKCVCCGKPAKKMVYWGKAY